MEENAVISATIESISQEFTIEKDEALLKSDDLARIHVLRNILAEKLNELLQNNFEKLRFFLYRVDIPEETVARLYTETNRSDLHFKLADLIIEREMQKVRTRLAYEESKRQEHGSGSEDQLPS
jgi:hypothetical protein